MKEHAMRCSVPAVARHIVRRECLIGCWALALGIGLMLLSGCPRRANDDSQRILVYFWAAPLMEDCGRVEFQEEAGEPEGIEVDDNSGRYVLGSKIKIKAIPNDGWRFVKWSQQLVFDGTEGSAEGTVEDVFDSETRMTVLVINGFAYEDYIVDGEWRYVIVDPGELYAIQANFEKISSGEGEGEAGGEGEP